MKNEKLKIKNLILFFLLINLLLAPLVSFAGSYTTSNGQTITYDGIVPCGGTGQPACQFCHVFVMAKGIFDLVLKFVGVIAVLMFVVGGFMFILSGANPKMMEKGKQILFSTAIGVVIIFVAYLVVNFVMTFPGFMNPNFGGNIWNPTQWFSPVCQINP